MFDNTGSYVKLSEAYREELDVIYSYYKKVVCFLMSKGLSYEDAQDATQEAYMDAIENIHTLRDIDNAKNWLYTIAWHRGIKYLNKNNKKNELEIAMDDLEEQNKLGVWEEEKLDEALGISTSYTLNSAIKKLSTTERHIVILYYVCEYKYIEISNILAMNPSTVRSICRRAIQKLRRIMTDISEDSF